MTTISSRVQRHFDKPETWDQEPIRSKLADSVLRIVSDLPDKMMVFFVCIMHADTEEMEPHALLGAITGLCERLPEQVKAVIYRTKTKYGFIVKLETEDPYLAGRFVIELNDKFALHEATTETYMVMDSQIRGKERIGKRSFQQVEHRDPLTTYLFPKPYPTDGVSQTKKIEVALWINEKFSLYLEQLTEDELEDIRRCLLAVITNNEVDFSLAIQKPFLGAERELRKRQYKFLRRQKFDPIRAMKDALNHCKNVDDMTLETLSLDPRIQLYQYAIEKRGLTSDKDVLSGWQDMVALRNQAAAP